MDLATATPVEIDTILADLYGKQWEADSQREYYTKAALEIENGIAKHLTGKYGNRYFGWKQETADEYHTKADGYQAKVDDLAMEMLPYEAEFARRPWTRFYLVQDGHVHSSMRCSTCNKMGKRTKFGWLPEWSGQSEAETLETLVTKSNKTILCTVCYPTAPVAWTVARVDDDQCPGSGTFDYPNDTARRGYYSGNYGVCTHCNARITVTSTGKMRKHKK